MKEFPRHWDMAQRERMGRVEALTGMAGMVGGYRIAHVSGTNGKGSICAFLQSILMQKYQRVGMYVSPHVVEECERIRINDRYIPYNTLKELMERARRNRADATIFEQYTAAALWYFEGEKPDAAVIEAGIGGAMDITNIVDPAVTITGAMGLDHTSLLGEDIKEVARQKAGIAKPGTPMILYPLQELEAKKAFLEECERIGAEVILPDETSLSIQPTPKGQKIDFQVGGERVETELSLLGDYQAYNALTAAYAAKQMGCSKKEIEQGLRRTVWPGRLEQVCEQPIILFDGAHNPQAAAALREALEARYPDRHIVLLMAVMEDKQAKEMVDILMPVCDYAIATTADPCRGMPAYQLCALMGEKGMAVQDPKKAYARAKAVCGMDGVLVVCGSLYLPSATGHYWNQKKQQLF